MFQKLLIFICVCFSTGVMAADRNILLQNCLTSYLKRDSNKSHYDGYQFERIDYNLTLKSNLLQGALKIYWDNENTKYSKNHKGFSTALILQYDEKGISRYQLGHSIHF